MTTTHILGDNGPRKSSFDPDLARKVTKYYLEHPEELNDKPIEYLLMPLMTSYARGVNVLHQACLEENNQNQPKFTLPDGRVVYRPNTFKENCLVRLKQFNTFTNHDGSQRTFEQRTEFMNYWNDSCCGIAYPAKEENNSKFKLILQSPELISLTEDFSQQFIYVDYAALACTRELDRNKAKYSQKLTSSEIDSHECWLALFEDDQTTLQDYRKMVEEAFALKYSQNQPHESMTFQLLGAPDKGQLWPVCVGSINSGSCAGGNFLGSVGRFLRCKP